MYIYICNIYIYIRNMYIFIGEMMCLFINHEIWGFPMISHTFQRPGGPAVADAPNPQLAKLKPQRDGAMSFFARLIRQEDS